MTTRGQRIRKARTDAGLSLTELADKIKILKQTLYKYENDIITNIPSDKIEAIASVCDVTPGYLMGWDEGIAAEMRTVVEIEKIIRDLSPDQRENLLQYARFLLNSSKGNSST